MQIPHSKPTLSRQDAQAVSKVVSSGMIAQGRCVAKLENALVKKVDQSLAVACHSGTAALHLSLIALGIKKGDEVIIPSYVCTSLLNAVSFVQAKARLADVSLIDGNIDPVSVKKLVNQKTKAIIVPHMFGSPADVLALKKLKVPIIEDCAQAIGAQFNGKPVGSFGDMSIFSFYATKVLAAGEGGVVATNKKAYAKIITSKRDYDQRDHWELSYNYKMTDMQATLASEQLKKLNGFVKIRREIAKKYNKAFKGLAVDLPQSIDKSKPIFFRYVMRLSKNKSKFIKLMAKKGISCMDPIYKPLHRYLNQKGFKQTELWQSQAVSIPIYPSLTLNEQNYIINSACQILES